ncbi:MAG: hypothetical protein C4308_07555, partial [Chitinophagaceae bacterium]
MLVQDSLATQEAIQDSLQQLYNEKIFKLDTTKIVSDSLRQHLTPTVSRINELRTEIGSILKKNSITKADLDKANLLIQEYRQNLDIVRAQKSDLETERDRLNDVLTQLNSEIKGLQESIAKISEENRQLNEAISKASIFITSE